jgi:hypothetical protein
MKNNYMNVEFCRENIPACVIYPHENKIVMHSGMFFDLLR